MAETVTSITRPAPFIEAAGQTFLEGLQSAIGDAKTEDLTKLFGPQFVAGPGAFTQQAQSLAGGLGSFAPFLQTAAAGTGPQAYQQFMSPFQKDVIDATLKEFDTQAAKGLPALAAQAINAGAFGGGREGVQRAEYQQASDRNRAALQSQLLQSGFGQAQQLAQQNFQNQMGLAQLSPSLVGQQISALGALGTQQQAQQQAQLSAQQQLLQQQANRPLDLAQQLGQGVTSLISGYPAQFTTQTQPTPSPLQTALGAGATLAGVYRAFS
jgi:hypothetical protein